MADIKLETQRVIRGLRGPTGPTGPGGGGAGEGLSSLSLIYSPGSGGSGPTVFDTWAGVIAQLAAARAANGGGTYTITIDDSIVTPAVIPAGVYDMTDVTLSGAFVRQTGLTIVEGVQFTKLRRITGQLFVTFSGTTPPVSDFAPAPNNIDLFIMDIHSSIMCSGTGPFFQDASTVNSQSILALLNGSMIMTGASPAIELAMPGTQFGVVGLTNATLQPSTVEGVAGSMLMLGILASGAFLSESQPAFLGTFNLNNQTESRLYPSPILTSSSSQPAQPNQVTRCDTTGGPITISLPSAFDLRGWSIIVKDVGGLAGTNSIAVVPNPPDTIDGAASALINTNMGSLFIISDGENNWMIV